MRIGPAKEQEMINRLSAQTIRKMGLSTVVHLMASLPAGHPDLIWLLRRRIQLLASINALVIG